MAVNDNDESLTIEYQYNDRGIRVGRVVDGVETRFLIDDLRPYAQVLEKYGATGDLKASYTYGYDLVSQQQGTQLVFHHVDGLGSTRQLTNAAGAIEDAYVYDAFGNLIEGGERFENSYLFAGEQRDSEVGLDYLRARYYNPAIGRFISVDPYEGTLSDPFSLHDYQYAHANPVVNIDPSGYITIQELGAGIGISGILSGLGITTLGAAGVLIGGGSLVDAAAKYDQFLAGFADIATFGVSSRLRQRLYGGVATQNHRGLFFNLGRFMGGVAGFSAGLAAPTTWGGTTWGQKALLGYDLFGSGLASYSSTRKFQEGEGTAWDLLAYLPLLTYASGLGLDWIATRGIVDADLAGNNELARRLSTTGLDQDEFISVRQEIQAAESWIVRRARWWADLRDYTILYRGQGSLGEQILSPIARSEGLDASYELVRRMQAEGLSNEQIASFTARFYDEDITESAINYAFGRDSELLSRLSSRNLLGEPLGSAGIPTSAIPGIASSFAGEDGVTMVLRLPRQVPIRPNNPSPFLRFEEEYVVLHQIPNSNVINVISGNDIPPIRAEQGEIIIGYQ